MEEEHSRDRTLVCSLTFMYVYYTVLPVVKINLQMRPLINSPHAFMNNYQLAIGNIILLQTIYCGGDFPVPMHVQLVHLPPNLLLCDILPVSRPSYAGGTTASCGCSLTAIFADTATYLLS